MAEDKNYFKQPEILKLTGTYEIEDHHCQPFVVKNLLIGILMGHLWVKNS